MSEHEGYAIGTKVELLPVPGVPRTGEEGLICVVISEPWTLPEGWRETGDYADFDGAEAYIYQDTNDLAAGGWMLVWPVAFMRPIADDDERVKKLEQEKWTT